MATYQRLVSQADKIVIYAKDIPKTPSEPWNMAAIVQNERTITDCENGLGGRACELVNHQCEGKPASLGALITIVFVASKGIICG